VGNRASRDRNPAKRYIKNVLSGREVVGELVALAVERHERDLVDGPARGLIFSESHAQYALDFYKFCCHSKGEWAGQTFVPAPWQAFIRWSLFGWLITSSYLRRFRTGYVTVARKNGKSTDAAVLGHHMLIADNEPGAEVYTAATKRDQARIVHSEATRMVQSSTELSSIIKVFRDNLSIQGTASKYEPLGADADTHDGLNPHCVLLDELHAHKKRDQYDVLWTGMGARRQPLMYIITTAGASRESICYELDNHSVQVLRQTKEDDAWFAYVARPDEDDLWDDPKSWKKGNPNLGVSVYPENLRNDFNKAKDSLSAQNSFKRLRLNIWTQQINRAIDMDKWNACNAKPQVRDGDVVYMGLDLSSKLDITAAAAVRYHDDTKDYSVEMMFWIPENNIIEKAHRDRVPYDAWVENEYMIATPGNTVDQEYVEAWIAAYAKRRKVQQIGFDPWNATFISQRLQDVHGLDVVEMRQGYKTMSEPTKFLLGLIADGRLRHGDNPVLKWMADNLELRNDGVNDNVAPIKPSQVNRIDGIVALILALGRAMLTCEKTSPGLFLLD
jgi:phage terminase large subunit-like protein